jgi:1-acylglycerone phosphate reductase
MATGMQGYEQMPIIKKGICAIIEKESLKTNWVFLLSRFHFLPAIQNLPLLDISPAMASPPRKTVLITGCSAGGIGSALAEAFHAQGLRVFATARDLSKVANLKALGMDVLNLDIEDEASLAAAVKKITATTGGTLDILVNNSGVGAFGPCFTVPSNFPFALSFRFNLPTDHNLPLTIHSKGQAGPIIDSDLEHSRKMFEVNFFGRVATTLAFAPLILKSKGIILNIGSIAGVCPQPWKGMYNACCAAVHLWSDTLRIEMEPFGVRVILVRWPLFSLIISCCLAT